MANYSKDSRFNVVKETEKEKNIVDFFQRKAFALDAYMARNQSKNENID